MSGMTYDLFVGRVLGLLAPVLPEGISPETSFSGSAGEGRQPGPDSALLAGQRAYTLLATAALAYGATGVSPDDYDIAYGVVTGAPLVPHSAYARNLRRWESGTLPRKRRARADFVLVATCWACGWEDGHDADELVRGDVLSRLSAWAGSPVGSRPEVAAALWGLSARAYRASLDLRESRRRGHGLAE